MFTSLASVSTLSVFIWHSIAISLLRLSFLYCCQMAKYFTAYRIDHILGFFRIWELPEHAMTGLVGKFRPAIPLSQVLPCQLDDN